MIHMAGIKFSVFFQSLYSETQKPWSDSTHWETDLAVKCQILLLIISNTSCRALAKREYLMITEG